MKRGLLWKDNFRITNNNIFFAGYLNPKYSLVIYIMHVTDKLNYKILNNVHRFAITACKMNMIIVCYRYLTFMFLHMVFFFFFFFWGGACLCMLKDMCSIKPHDIVLQKIEITMNILDAVL